MRDVRVVWVVWGREFKEDREFKEGKASFFYAYGKKNEAYRKVRHVNLKLVSS